jgi:hypothetical protein
MSGDDERNAAAAAEAGRLFWAALIAITAAVLPIFFFF